MKLIGIERTDLDKAKKVLAMLHKLQTISNEFEESSIKVYNEKGNEVEDCSYNKSEYSEGWCEQVYFITMKNKDLYYNWICYVDMDDGYHSYAGLYQIKNKELCLTKNLEAFNLNCSYTENKRIEKEVKDSWLDKKIYNIHLKIKCKHKVIFECYTDYSDSYYPIGIIHDEVTKLELKYDNVAG